MTHTSRRTFLKSLGATLASVGIVTGSAGVHAQAAGIDGAGSALADVSEQRRSEERMHISQHDLAMLVAEQLREWVALERTFTAYDMTRALRVQYPRLQIMHHDVRAVVHNGMRELVDRQFYRQQPIRFPTGDALRYVPA
jgi:hypothetical protein